LTVVLDAIGSAMAPQLYADHWSDPGTLANLETPLGVQVGLTATFLNEIWWLNVWPGSNSPFWSLGYEAAYYVLFGIAFYQLGTWTRVAGLILFSLFIGPKILMLLPVWLLGVFAWELYKRVTIPPLASAVLCITAILAYVAFFASGAEAALDRRERQLLLSISSSEFGLSTNFLSANVSGVIFASVIFGFKGLEGVFAPLLGRYAQAIRLGAGCTFSMYLYHYPLIHFFRACTIPVFGDLNVRNWFITAVVLIGTLTSIYALAMLTEQKKREVRRLITMLLGFLRRSFVSVNKQGSPPCRPAKE